MSDDTLIKAMVELLDLLEEKVRENVALRAITSQLGIADVDDAIQKVLAKEELQKALQKVLFRYRSIRENVDRLVSERRGEVLPPPAKPN